MMLSICLYVTYIGPRTERPRKTKIGADVAHVTRDSDTNFKVTGQGHQAALFTAVLARQAAAAAGVGTCWPWETAAYVRCRLLGGARRFGAHGVERVRGISCRPPAYSLLGYEIITSQVGRLWCDHGGVIVSQWVY